MSRNTVLASLALAASLAAGSFARAAAVQTVWVIAMENHNLTGGSSLNLQGNVAAPYINSLMTPGNANAAQSSWCSNYINAGTGVHPSEPNYQWAEAGTNYNKDTNTTLATDSDPSASAKNIFVTTPHLTGQLNNAGVSWRNYQEDYQILNSTTSTGGDILKSKSGTSTTVTNPYYNTKQYNYAVKHNPMAFFSDTQTQNVRSFDQLRSDIASNNFAHYNWITPNQYNDMHSAITGGFTYQGTAFTGDQAAIAIGDNFLSIIVPQIMATAAYQNNGAIILWWDESETGDTSAVKIPEIVLSPLAKGNAYNSNLEYNHSSDILTMEKIFQVGSTLNNQITVGYGGTAGKNAVPTANDLSDLFVSGTIPATVPEPTAIAAFAPAAVLVARRRRA